MRLDVTNSDGSFKWSQPLHVIERLGSRLVCEWRVGDEVTEPAQALIQPSTTRVIYWTDRWYNVIHNSEPMYDRVWYCNVATPAVVSDDALSYTDLDLDVAIATDGQVAVLDEDEFAVNQTAHGHAAAVTTAARAAVAEILGLIQRREFPFDYDDLTRPYTPVCAGTEGAEEGT
jgi:protein associated with RNAse G/E